MYRVVDHRFTVACDDPTLDGLIGEVLAHCWVDDDAEPDETLHVIVDGQTTTLQSDDGERTVPAERSLQTVVSTANLRGAQRRPADLPVLHGGAVAVEGEATLLLGRSGSGKSTLVAALVADDAQYLADELVAVRSSTCVAGYPKSITLKPGSWAGLPFSRPERGRSERRFIDEIDYVSAEHAGTSAVLDEAVPITLVFPTWTEGQVGHRVEPMSAGATLLALCEAAHLPVGAGAFSDLADLAGRCAGFQLAHGDTRSALAGIESIDGGRERPVDVDHIPAVGDSPICAVGFGDEAVVMRVRDGQMALIENPGVADLSAAAADGEHPLHQIFEVA